MMRFIKPFLGLIVAYHLIVTLIGYGILQWSYPEIRALGRDALRGIFFIVRWCMYLPYLKWYLRTRKRPWISLIGLLIFGGIISISKGKTPYDIFVGIKYGFLYLGILLSASYIGYTIAQKNNHAKIIQKFITFLKYLLIITITVGFIRQGLKFFRPDRFLDIGYGPFNDFKFGVKPPIYYLTWYQGTPRRQGIFSWPNNYGYFLIAFLPAIIYLVKSKRSSITSPSREKTYRILNKIRIGLWIGAIILTLSRTAYIGGLIGIAMINFQWIKRHKKISRILGIGAIAGIVAVSILKWASTLGHIQAKFGSIAYVIQQPEWYGLGTSWPAVHHNGTILPENYYIQLMLDIGTIGFLIRALCISQIMIIIKKIKGALFSQWLHISQPQIVYPWIGLCIGRIALLIMGIFLHVFEDSMINYLFFISRWIMTGYLSTYLPSKSS